MTEQKKRKINITKKQTTTISAVGIIAALSYGGVQLNLPVLVQCVATSMTEPKAAEAPAPPENPDEKITAADCYKKELEWNKRYYALELSNTVLQMEYDRGDNCPDPEPCPECLGPVTDAP